MPATPRPLSIFTSIVLLCAGVFPMSALAVTNSSSSAASSSTHRAISSSRSSSSKKKILKRASSSSKSRPTKRSIGLKSSSSVSAAVQSQDITLKNDYVLSLDVDGKFVLGTKETVFDIERGALRFNLLPPAGTVIAVNVRDAFSLKGQPVFSSAALSSQVPSIPDYAIIAPTQWFKISGVTNGHDFFYNVKGVLNDNGHWEMLSYPFNDLLFTFAAIPANPAGTLKTTGIKYAYAYLRLKDSSASDCRMLQNMYRNAGAEPPPCEDASSNNGIVVQANGAYAKVMEFIPESLGSRSALRPGDHILSIDNVSVAGLTSEAVRKMLYAPPRDHQVFIQRNTQKFTVRFIAE